MTIVNARPTPSDRSSGGRLVAADGRDLPLRATRLVADAAAGLARVVVEQRFANPHAEPLRVTYSLALPHDGVVSGFAFRVGARRVVGEVDRRARARERFEDALLDGRTAGLLEQDRGSLFTQEIGNVPPGVEVVALITVDQPLVWLGEGAWEWRFPTVVAPRYLGEEGRVTDAHRVHQDITPDDSGPVLSLLLVVRDEQSDVAPSSPSHELCASADDGTWSVSLAPGARLDRDVVVRWPVVVSEPGLALDVGREVEGRPCSATSHGLLTVVPPTPEAGVEHVPRDLVVLLDASGSMSGEPLEQGKRAVRALVETLDERDTLELIEFASCPRRWKRMPVRMGEDARRDALAWLAKVRASGMTEMRDAVHEALTPLRDDAQRQVVIVTDGFIGFEQEIVEEIRERLPRGCRLHAIAVGSAPNRSLTTPCARAGRGVEIVLGLGEGVDTAVRRLVARTTAPIVTELELEGRVVLDVAPRACPDLFAGAPARLSVQLRPEGGTLTVRGRTAQGPWESVVEVPARSAGEGSRAVVALHARERVEDLEVARAAGGHETELDAEVERLGLEHQIATRLTSWVAISEEPGVDPREPVRRVRQPQQLPAGLSAEGLGLRAARGASAAGMLVNRAAQRLESAVEGHGLDADRREAREEQAELETSRRPRRPARLVARLVHRRAVTRLVFEILVRDGKLDWERQREVVVIWSDGSHSRGRVLPDDTTRPGPVSDGTTVRLFLELEDERPSRLEPERLALRVDGEWLEIPVSLAGGAF